MSQNDFVRPNGMWLNPFVLTPNDLRRFDVAQYKAVTTQGGQWFPTTPISIGGAGLALTGNGHVLHGAQTASGGRLVLGHNDYPTFVDAVSRSISWTFADGFFTEFNVGLATGTMPQTSIGTSFTLASAANMSFPIDGRDLHCGASLTTAVVTFRIGQQHHVVPANTPTVRFSRSDVFQDWYLNVSWLAHETHILGDICVPSTPNGFVYSAILAGTSGAGEPTWPTTAGGSVNDNSGTGVTWVCTGYGPAPQWVASTVYTVGKIVQPSSFNANASNPPSPNGFLYKCTAVSGTGTSGANPGPAWPTTVGATVIDNPGANQVTWTCVGGQSPFPWVASTTYYPGQYVTPGVGGASPNGWIFIVDRFTSSGESGTNPPAWNTNPLATTVDNTVTWQSSGTMTIAAASLVVSAGTGAAYYDGGAAQTLTLVAGGGGPVVIETDKVSYGVAVIDEYGYGAFFAPSGLWYGNTGLGEGDEIQPTPPNGLWYEATAATGNTGATQPAWPTQVGATTPADGDVTWTCYGPVGASLNTYHTVVFNFGSIADMRFE